MIALIFYAMLFMHVLADFKLQGCMSDLKCKKWWKENAPDPLYRDDYTAALACHSIQWAFCIMLPIIAYAWYLNLLDQCMPFLVVLVPFNAAVHYFIDDEKANKLKINLVQDQIYHFIQMIFSLIAVYTVICSALQ